MPFKPGQSGNPSGKPKQRPFTDALRLALNDHEDEKPRQRTKLDCIVSALIQNAVDGDNGAIREIADRTEGKVPQQQILTGDEDGGPMQTVTRIELVDLGNGSSRTSA